MSLNNSLLMKEGFGKKESQNIFFKWLKKHAAKMGLVIVDPCCTQDLSNRPMRYNVSTGNMQYLDATQTWIDITSF